MTLPEERTLLEMADHLISLSGSVQLVHRGAEQVATARARLDRLDELLEALDEQVAFFSLADQEGFGTLPELSPDHRSSLIRVLDDLDARADTDIFDILQSQAYDDIWEGLNRVKVHWAASATQSWDEHAKHLLPPVQRQLLEAVQPHLSESKQRLVGKIVTRDQRLDSLARHRPKSNEDYSELVRLIDERNSWFDELEIATTPQIQDFLEATAGRGFPLSDLTPEIEQWMSDRGLRSGFVIRSRPNE